MSRTQRYRWPIAIVLILGVAGTGWWVNFRSRRLRAIDERIVQDVSAALVAELHGMPSDAEIARHYGRFEKFTNLRWERPNYLGQLVQRLDFLATAHFAQAQAEIHLVIVRGDAVIVRLEMNPSDQWRRENPLIAGQLEIHGDELWHVQTTGRARCTITGTANHPQFTAD